MVALDIDTELGVLGRGLRATSRKLSLRVMCATTTNLSMAVVLGCTVLHFSGHGEDVDGLAFEDGHGAAHMLNAATLSKLLRPHHAASTPIKLVVVSSCHSQRVAQAFIDAGVEHVVAVGTDSLLNDVAAQYFARQFYMSLAASKTVRAAFDSALAMVHRRGACVKAAMWRLSDVVAAGACRLSRHHNQCLVLGRTSTPASLCCCRRAQSVGAATSMSGLCSLTFQRVLCTWWHRPDHPCLYLSISLGDGT